MQFFDEKTLHETKLFFASAVARGWHRIPSDLASEILRRADELACVRGTNPHSFGMKIQDALNGWSKEEADTILLADTILFSWHRVRGMGGHGIIFELVREFAHLKDADMTQAEIHANFLVDEFGRAESEAILERYTRVKQEEDRREQSEKELAAARMQRKLAREKADRKHKFSLQNRTS